MTTGTPPTHDDLIAEIRAAGSDHAEFFGFPEREDGLFLQQDPEEYARFIGFMAQQPPSRLSLEIGIASGGQTKFLRDHWQVEKTIIVDIGQHPRHHHWPRIRKDVKTEIVKEIIGDSHSAEVRQQLMPYARQIDFAFIDGDHSYRGLRKDMFLAKELLMPGALTVLHDTEAVPDCKRVFEELEASKDFDLVENFANRFGISVWRYTGEDPRNVTWWNRRTGRGPL